MEFTRSIQKDANATKFSELSFKEVYDRIERYGYDGIYSE